MEMEEVFRKIAEENGTTPEQVRAEIQACIDEAYRNAPEGSAVKMKQNSVPMKGKIPTPEELIRYVVAELYRLQ